MTREASSSTAATTSFSSASFSVYSRSGCCAQTTLEHRTGDGRRVSRLRRAS